MARRLRAARVSLTGGGRRPTKSLPPTLSPAVTLAPAPRGELRAGRKVELKTVFHRSCGFPCRIRARSARLEMETAKSFQ